MCSNLYVERVSHCHPLHKNKLSFTKGSKNKFNFKNCSVPPPQLDAALSIYLKTQSAPQFAPRWQLRSSDINQCEALFPPWGVEMEVEGSAFRKYVSRFYVALSEQFDS